MEILKGLDICVKNSAVSLGKFDGLHRGHRLLLHEILEKNQSQVIELTFTIFNVPLFWNALSPIFVTLLGIVT